MMVLVGMSDSGLVIWPTHRVLGGMKGYSIESFIAAAKGLLKIEPAGNDLKALEGTMTAAAKTAVKLIFPLVLFIFPGIFVVLVGPAAITMVRNMFPMMAGN